MKMKIPGVTVSEAAGMGSAVEMVDTAIPVFIGYSEKAVELDGTSLTGVPKRIASLGDYEEYFGGAYRETLYVDVTQAAGATLAAQFVNPPAGTTSAPTLTAPFFLPSFLLHGSIALFYANGGRACYVLSVGPYGLSQRRARHQQRRAEGRLAGPRSPCRPDTRRDTGRVPTVAHRSIDRHPDGGRHRQCRAGPLPQDAGPLRHHRRSRLAGGPRAGRGGRRARGRHRLPFAPDRRCRAR